MPQPKDLDWLNGYKSKTHTYAVFKRPTSLSRDTYKLKMRGWKKRFHANGDQKKARVAIFISDKIDFKMKNIFRDKEGHYIIIKGSRRYKNFKYLCTQHRFITVYKATAINLKRTNQQ